MWFCEVSEKWDMGVHVPKFPGFHWFSWVAQVEKPLETNLHDYWCGLMLSGTAQGADHEAWLGFRTSSLNPTHSKLNRMYNIVQSCMLLYSASFICKFHSCWLPCVIFLLLSYCYPCNLTCSYISLRIWTVVEGLREEKRPRVMPVEHHFCSPSLRR